MNFKLPSRRRHRVPTAPRNIFNRSVIPRSVIFRNKLNINDYCCFHFVYLRYVIIVIISALSSQTICYNRCIYLLLIYFNFKKCISCIITYSHRMFLIACKSLKCWSVKLKMNFHMNGQKRSIKRHPEFSSMGRAPKNAGSYNSCNATQ